MRAVFLLVLLLLCAPLSLSAQNLVSNGGFENAPTPGVPDQPIPGWTMVDQGWFDMRGFHWVLQDEVVYSGDYALKMYLEPDPASWGAGWGVYQTVNLTANRVYEIRAKWMYDGLGTEESYMNFFAFPGTWYDSTDVNTVRAVRSTTTAWGYPAFLPMPLDWESTLDAPGPATGQYRGRYRAPSPFALQLTLYFRITSLTGTGPAFYIDDVEVVDVEAAYELAGTVRDASNAPIAGALVTVSTGGSATTDANGAYKIYFPNAGAATVTASHPQYFDSAVAKTITARQNNTQSFNLNLRPTGTLTGVVTDGTNPIPYATVSATEGGYSTQANESGVYSMVMVEGDYTIEAVAPGYLRESAPATISDGQTTTLNFALTLRYVNPANALTNGDFEAGTLEPWTTWCGTHFTDHRKVDPSCPYQDQWIGVQETTAAFLVQGDGYQGSTGALIGLWRGVEPGQIIGWGANGGLRQQCYVTPGKYYRARAMFKGSVSPDINDYEFSIGLVDGRFDPGVYLTASAPPPFTHDLFLMSCGYENALKMLDNVPDGHRWWNNIMATRTSGRNGKSSWDWQSTMDYIAPRNYLASGIRKATGEIMTVVLKVNAIRWNTTIPQFAVFDNVVLEEVPEPTAGIALGDLKRLDLSPPYNYYPELLPEYAVDLSAAENAKLVTGVFDEFYVHDWVYYYIEEADRSTGIRVNVNEYDYFAPQQGDLVSLVGKLTMTSSGELVIKATNGSQQVRSSDNDLPAPVALVTKSASARLPYVNPLGQTNGPANTGLLARLTGRVTSAFDFGTGIWVQIDDGSGAEFWVVNAPWQPNIGDQVVATGIIGVLELFEGWPVMCLQVRTATALDDFYQVQTPQ